MTEKLFQEPFPKHQNWSYLIEQQSKVLYGHFIEFVFIFCQVECCRNILKLSYSPLAFTSYKSCFYSYKSLGLKLVFLPHFLHGFWRKIFLLLYSINWSNFIVSLPLLRQILYSICFAVVRLPGYDIINFEINLIFLIKPFSLHDQKVITKT